MAALVRLGNGHLAYRTTLSGIDRGSVLRPVIGGHCRTMPSCSPTDWRRRNGVRAGERVWVEALEGARTAVAALAGEEDSIDVLRFRVDRARLPDFMLAAREVP
jgi:hypothetical protein